MDILKVKLWGSRGKNGKRYIMQNNSSISTRIDLSYISVSVRHLLGGSRQTALQMLLYYCTSEKFKDFCEESHRLSDVKFTAWPNEELENRFLNTFDHDQHQDDERIILVFHGTEHSNIPLILRDGLDPTLRNGQMYGPGEYFHTHPSHSLSYNYGGCQMLVFAVIVPPRMSDHLDRRRCHRSGNPSCGYRKQR